MKHSSKSSWTSFFLVRLFLSGVATPDFQSPIVPIFCILLRHFNLNDVFFHLIHKPTFLAFPVSSFLTTLSSASFSQYTHHLSSVYIYTEENTNNYTELFSDIQTYVTSSNKTDTSKYTTLAGLPGFARDHCSIIMSISAFYF